MKPGKASAENHRFSIRLLTGEEFSQYQEAWNKLLDSSGSESFFLKWEWLFTFWETVDKKDASLQVWLCHDGSELVGIAPFYIYSTTFIKMPVRKMAFLGDRVASDYMDIFAAPGYEEICCREVLRQVRHSSAQAYDVFELEGICNDSNLYQYLAAGHDANRDMQLLPGFDCPRTMLDSSFEKYLHRLSASTRYSLGRKQRKLERKFGGAVIEHLDLKENPEMLDVLFDLHKQRWDELKDKTSTFSSLYREKFNNKLLQYLDEGDGFFSCMSIDGEIVSIMYIFVYKNNAFFYQNGWNPVFASCGVGILNIQHAIHHAIESGYKSFDFLRGEEAYKYKFCEEMRTAYLALYFGSGPYGRVAKMLFILKAGLKDLLSRLRNLRGQGVKPDEHYFDCLQDRQH